ncbi:MAG TPA: biotin--[acetyl-CoA-carboxylase] ligase [Candidatus Limiplasma sp.]|nr:biotin--[acetyl-CoA-carboxylase] ligase [Candidatus Limiplasma sp.]HPS80750.1 biotin--[acetyl-CoA-carboxylase] ligase [Candidatus Limiplasma sp.]
MTLKERILTELEANRETALSGQLLAERFGVSRNAVWKAVNALKQEGYEIASTQNLGYRISPQSDRASESGIRANLNGFPLNVYVADTVDSTNSWAKQLYADGAEAPFLAAAEAQTAGRGRYGRAFFSPKGAGLYMTVALAPRQAIENMLSITAYAAVCVANAVERATGQALGIKWVNDLLLGTKKVGGILTEAVTDFESGTVETLFIGIGLNLRESDVPAEWKEIVGFLGCSSPLKNRLAAEIAMALMQYDPEDRSFWTAYRERSRTVGRAVLCTQGNRQFQGRAVAIAPDGALVVETDAGETVALKSGEAKLLE